MGTSSLFYEIFLLEQGWGSLGWNILLQVNSDMPAQLVGVGRVRFFE